MTRSNWSWGVPGRGRDGPRDGGYGGRDGGYGGRDGGYGGRDGGRDGGYGGGRGGGYGGGRGGDYGGGRGGDYGGGRGGRGGGDFRGGGRGGRGGGRGGGGGAAPLAVKSGNFDVEVNHFPLVHLGAKEVILHKHLVEIDGWTTLQKPGAAYEDNCLLLEKFFQNTPTFSHIRINQSCAYDGDRILVALEPIKAPVQEIMMFGKKFAITITWQSAHEVTSAFQSSRAADETAQLVDIVVQAAARVNHEKFTRAKFARKDEHAGDKLLIPSSTEPGLHLWMGHSQQVAPSLSVDLMPRGTATGSENPFQKALSVTISVCIAPKAIPSIDECPLVDYVRKRFRVDLLTAGPNNGPDARMMRKIVREIGGLKAFTRHIPSKTEPGKYEKRVFRVHSITLDHNALTYSFQKDDAMITIADYWKQSNYKPLRYPKAPLVEAKGAKKSHVPIECVYLCRQGLKSMSENIRGEMADLMCQDPQQRRSYIKNVIHEGFQGNDILKHFDLQLSEEPLKWRAELLPAPLLCYSGSSTITPQQGAWNLRDKVFREGKDFSRVLIVDLSPGEALNGNEFCNALSRNKEILGMGRSMIQTKYQKLNESRLEAFASHVKQNMDNLPHLTVVLLPRKDSKLYRRVKTAFDAFTFTQCLVIDNTPGLNPRKDASRAAGHYGNVLSKVNQKLGGFNHFVGGQRNPVIGIQAKKPSDFAIISLNLSHPQGPSRGDAGLLVPTVTSLVCSANTECTVYTHAVSVQSRGDHVVKSIREMLNSVLKQRQQYMAKKGTSVKQWPHRLLLLRDGGEESQMHQMLEKEVAAIEEEYKAQNMDQPLITYIAAVRHHNTRFFDPENAAGGRANLPPGTFICLDGVEHGDFGNFYLLGHAGIKGTSRPVRYFVIRDDLAPAVLGPSKMQLKFWAELMFQQCFNYQRCQRAVRVPAPIYYADLLAQRARCYVSEALSSKFGLHEDGDTMSVASGFSEKSNISVETREKFFTEINQTLVGVVSANENMFYC